MQAKPSSTNSIICFAKARACFKGKLRNVKLLTQSGQQFKLSVFLTKSLINGTSRYRDNSEMETILNRLVNNWDIFSIWVTNQPTFVEVAFGVGLFYVVLQIIRTIYHIIMFLLSGLFSVPRRFKKQKDMRVKPRQKKSAVTDEEVPPFVFR